ncbi:aminomethyl-transferring glycine dehydrogenase [Arcanobacterium haemolyticum]|nr:aminomethyl-transferring glycine dehydrogenase [Arcanobacterium haemolyticum]
MTEFVARHIGPSDEARARMLDTLGVSSLTALMDEALPETIRSTCEATALPEPLTEADVELELARLAGMNRVRTSMIGQGFYDVVLPAVIRRAILENPSWYTAYTPYQPEISQGRLEALLNFQTLITELTGLGVAGASLLDEASAVAEAMLLASRATKGRTRLAVHSDIFDSTRAVLENRAEASGIELIWIDDAPTDDDLKDCAGLVVQYPSASGRIRNASDYENYAELIHAAGGKFIVAADLMALAIFRSPASLGADIAVGTVQRFGIPMSGGGPHAGYIATTPELERQIPGRLVGVSRDRAGHPAVRLALQTREQHIRREKATSNICTAQALLAIIASMYAVYHGPQGIKAIAQRIHDRARALAGRLAELGLPVRHSSFFDTIELDLGEREADYAAALLAHDITVYRAGGGRVRISCDERTTPQIVDTIVEASAAFASHAETQRIEVESAMYRHDEFLTQAVFHSYHSETAMMRYLRRLAAKDYALDRGMIPLGSCTMKLNAAVEVSAMTLEGFARIHPLAPESDHAGYASIVADMERWLVDLTGYDSVSLQPNAGSQGELAGLLAIRGYHASRGDGARDVCLIPASAHGTNAASAGLAGFKVVVVKTAPDGSIDMDHLADLLATYEGRIGAIMVTYPSTHGIYESDITDITRMIHDAGGQVYVDGANLNALVGWSRPGDFGGDVSHLNLHKTFAIPHGGGGPGIGPVAAKSHLAPFLPGFPGVRESGRPGEGAVTASKWGSVGVLPLSWAYLRLMGVEGLKEATAMAVLAANYIAARLKDTLPILYSGPGGRVAHECIVDVRGCKQRAGITVDDIAKRLIDYGFHAPTMSFPVAGTLMVEPTESEDLDELDRFCDALIAISGEVDEVERGTWSSDDNPLVNAPHTAECLTEEWNHPYSRDEAVYPGVAEARRRGRNPEFVRSLVDGKYWPPVRRIDGAWGDRNFQCTCPPPEAFEEKASE